MEEARKYELGVLLVHGIGSQPLGEAIVRWGDVLLNTIRRGTRNAVSTAVVSAEKDPPHAEAVIEIASNGQKERWLVAEGWWADAFLPPSYRELVSWSLRALPWALAMHVAERFWQEFKPEGTFTDKFIPRAAAAGKLLLVMTLAPFFIISLALALLLGLLPIPQLRSLILTAQGTLVSSIGDSLAFVESPVRAALIRSRIIKSLASLKERCQRTIIIAHSQGAALVLEALAAFGQSGTEEKAPTWPDPATGDQAPNTLVTFGAGTNKLATLKAVSDVPPDIRINTVHAIGALTVLGCASAWLYLNAPGLAIVKAFAAFLVFTLVTGVAGWIIERILRFAAGRWSAIKAREQTISMSAYLVLMISGVIGLITYHAYNKDLPTFAVSICFVALILLLGAIFTMLSKKVKTLTTTVRKPPGLESWIDLYASSDPVPNGATRTISGDEPESSRVWNEGSMFADHTTYWENLDGFVLPVVRACASTAQSPWSNQLPVDTPELARHAEWRVSWLKLARFAVVSSWLAFGLCVWILHATDLPMPFELPIWLKDHASMPARFIILAGTIALSTFATLAILRALWRSWVRAEQQKVLAHSDPGGNEFWPLLGIGAVVWSTISFTSVAAKGELKQLVVNPGELLDGIAPIFGLAMIFTWILLKLRPAPRKVSPPATPTPAVETIP